MNRAVTRSSLARWALIIACACAAPAALAASPEQVARDLESVSTLVNRSKSAAQIDSSKVPEALALRDRARELLGQAEAAAKAGDTDKVAPLLTEAKKAFFEAVRLGSPKELKDAQLKATVERRVASVKALEDAAGRVSGTAAKADIGRGHQQIADAEALLAAGQYEQALAGVKTAELTFKAVILAARDHTEQKAVKDCASKEKEYLNCELPRNDDYAQLAPAAAENAAAGTMRDIALKALDKARALRKDAEAQASAKDYAAAVKTLEDSTAEYKKAVRAGGFPVP